MIEEEYPSGRKVKNEFESDGDLARIYGTANAAAQERTYANSFNYTPDGKIESLKLGNGLWEKAKFNSRLQVTEIALGHGLDGDLWKLGYQYGELESDGTVNAAKNTGNVARQTLSFNGLAQPFVQSYKYDSLYRLKEARETSGTGTSAPQTWKETFDYDRYGNRTAHDKFFGTTLTAESNITDPTIDPNTNRFQTGQGYSFDKNGNLTADAESRGFTFNADNKQTKVIQNGQVVGEYFFDGEGKRVKKKVYNGGVVSEETIFVYSSGKLIAEYSTAPPPPNSTTNYTATDQLGSPRVISNALGEVTSRRDFMPFGEQVYSDASYRPTNLKYNFGDGLRQKFTGYQKDEETQLDFAEARMYENRHARFTAVDPLLASGKSANPQTFNRYTYVLNNPLVLTDPDGLQVGIAHGKVYTNGSGGYRIFRGRPFGGYTTPVTHTIHTTTTIRGVEYNATVRQNGWTVGDRVDGARFEAPAAASAQARSDISVMAGEVVQGVNDGFTGIAKGVGNAPAIALNGITGTLLNHAGGSLIFRGSNPLAVPLPFAYSNTREASYGSAGSTGTLFGLGVAGGTISGGSSMLSVVPEESSITSFPAIKLGSAGGPTAGEPFPASVRAQAFNENPGRICVFCRQSNATQVDHAIARANGGNATLDNAQLTCYFCNPSKGVGPFPRNPAPGYTGPFPPPWW